MKNALVVIIIFIATGLVAWYFVAQEPFQKKGDILGGFENATQEFHIDYEKLKEGGKNHPKIKELLAQIKEYEQMLSDDDTDNDRSAYEVIAFDSRQLGDNEGAILGYRAAIALYTENVIAYGNLATSYKETGEYEKAEAAYRKIIELDFMDISNYRSLADLYLYFIPEKKGKIPSVIGEGLFRVPNHPDLLSYLAVFYQNEGNTQKAIDYYERLMEEAPTNDSARRALEKLRQ